MSEAWWKKGIRFECLGNGRCCVSHGDASFVYVTLEDRRKMAEHLGLTTSAFTRRYCRWLDGLRLLIDAPDRRACVFLEGKGCAVYPARPTQCRTWPFWPELLEHPGLWAEAKAFCPGIGRGRIWSAEEIERLCEEQRRANTQQE